MFPYISTIKLANRSLNYSSGLAKYYDQSAYKIISGNRSLSVI
jgi:hypothetical protein